MKYLVINTDEPAYYQSFIVEANNKKDAIDKVYDEYGHEYLKKDFSATKVEDLEYENEVHCIN